jgi:riboflavin kinase/FMN adenylyltransferase
VNIHHGLPHFPSGTKRIVTTGTFDGVHLGHQALLSWMVAQAKSEKAESVVLTFHPHPRKVLFGKDSGLELLQTMDQRSSALSMTGLDHLVVQPFDLDFARLKPTDFVREVLVEGLGCTTVVVGHDHRFGAGREGDVELLRACGEAYGFNVVHIPAHIEDELTVSSTKVRHCLQDGNVTRAAQLMGRPFCWTGQVVRGDGRGRTLGFPTANLSATEPDQLLPAEGVYAANVTIDGPLHPVPSMVHIGPRPTFDSPNASPTIEVHLLDTPSIDLYGKKLTVAFEQGIRSVQKFDGAEALVAQLTQDALQARKLLGYGGTETNR